MNTIKNVTFPCWHNISDKSAVKIIPSEQKHDQAGNWLLPQFEFMVAKLTRQIFNQIRMIVFKWSDDDDVVFNVKLHEQVTTDTKKQVCSAIIIIATHRTFNASKK